MTSRPNCVEAKRKINLRLVVNDIWNSVGFSWGSRKVFGIYVGFNGIKSSGLHSI